MLDRLINRWLERVPYTAWGLYGARQWAAAWAQTMLGPLIADDPE